MSLFFFFFFAFSCFPKDRQWNGAKLLSSLFGMAARAAVHKPIPHDKWDLILQVFCVISVGNEGPNIGTH